MGEHDEPPKFKNIKVELSRADVDVQLRLLRLIRDMMMADECKSLARRLVREHLRPLGEKLRIEIMNGTGREKLLLSEPCAFQVHRNVVTNGIA